jgi:hypothetical protein
MHQRCGRLGSWGRRNQDPQKKLSFPCFPFWTGRFLPRLRSKRGQARFKLARPGHQLSPPWLSFSSKAACLSTSCVR